MRSHSSQPVEPAGKTNIFEIDNILLRHNGFDIH